MKKIELKYLPHILRKITAKSIAALKTTPKLIFVLAPEKKRKLSKFSPLLFLIGYLIFVIFYPLSTFEEKKLNVIKHPNSPSARSELSAEFKKNNQYQDALGEINMAIFLSPLNQYYQRQKNNLTYIKNTPNRLLKEETYWSTTLKNYPNYRDGLFQLAQTQYQLKQFVSSTATLYRTLEIDPNFQPAKDLLQITGKLTGIN